MSRSRRALRLLLIVLVASPLVLWLAANVFLNVGLEPILNGKPEKLRITWSFVWMGLPGHVDVRGLEIRGQGKNDQWLISVDHATAEIDIEALTERTFRASNVKGNGGGFRYRFRATEPVDPATDDTPPIAGLTNPPDPIPQPGKGKKGPWKIDLKGVEVDNVQDLWVETYRYAGSAHVVGDLTLGNEIALSGHVTMPTGKMFRGSQHEMVDSLTGEMGGSITGIIRGQPITRDVLMNLDATAHVKAETDDLSFVNYYLQSAPWLSLDGRAELAVDIDIVDGTWALGSLITAHTTDLAVNLFDYQIRGDGTARLEVVNGTEAPETHMGVSYGQFTIKEKVAEAAPASRAPEGEATAAPDAAPAPAADAAPSPAADAAATVADPLVAGNGFELTAVSPDTQIGKPLKNMNVLIKIPESKIPDVKRFDRYLPTGTGLSIVSGSGRLAGAFQVSTSSGDLGGGVDINGDDLGLVFDGLLITSDLALHARMSGGSGKYDFSKTAVYIDHLGIRDTDPEAAGEVLAKDWWARITVTDGHLVAGATPTFLDARITMKCANSEPFVAVLAEKKNLPKWLRNGLYIENVNGKAAVKIGNDTIVLDPLEVNGGTELNVKMRFYRNGTASTGAMYARFNKLSVAVDIDPGDTDIHIFDAKDWYEGNNADKAAAKDAKQAKKDAKKDAKAKKKAAKKSDG
jgi:hypothetical protein